MTALWLIAGLLALLYSSACHRSGPFVGLDPGASAYGTISGLVHGPGATPLSGRTVELVNVATGERRTATTVSNGGFSIDVPRGRYRLELPLRKGESLRQGPDLIDLSRGGADAPIEFDVSPARSVRHPSYRQDNSLGSPIAWTRSPARDRTRFHA